MSSSSIIRGDVTEFLEKMRAANTVGEEEFYHRMKTGECGFTGCQVKEHLFICSKCKIRQYCSRDHQKADWRQHKKFCRAPFIDSPGLETYPLTCDDTIPYSVRAQKALELAESLVKAFRQDYYPPKEDELVVGIKKQSLPDNTLYIGVDTPVGILMYSAWVYLFKGYVEFDPDSHADEGDEDYAQEIQKRINLFKKEIAQALLAGELPQWFKASSEKYRDLFLNRLGQRDVYTEELRLRDYKGIKWDTVKHAGLRILPRVSDPPLSEPLSTDPFYWLNQRK